ncbi:MAG: hypothetical protein HN855_08970 [Anaerolineae bacterium]|nr:hypothetical protein [Anaerolineae bacterium]MBT7072997.1 hypothetical protein [Anaerolineae bacterium]MBT7325277.1 hypothetical protein [Anaerolineae bacterium]
MMATYVKVPFSTNRIAVVAFPNKCVYCELPAETKVVQPVEGQSHYEDNRGRFVTKSYSTKVTIPFCKTHMKESERNNTILKAINILAGLGAFPIVLFLAPLLGSAGDNFILLVGALFLAIMIGVGLVWIITLPLKYLVSLFVHSLKDQTGLGFLGSGVLGVKIKFTPKKDALLFRFVNAKIASDFSSLNGVK